MKWVVITHVPTDAAVKMMVLVEMTMDMAATNIVSHSCFGLAFL
jgi:hypothetical protein